MIRDCRWHWLKTSVLMTLWSFCSLIAPVPGEAVGQDRELIADGIPGTLVIAGGGHIPEAARDAFVEVVSDGRVVVIAAASDDPPGAADRAAQWLTAAGITEVVTPEVTEQGEVKASDVAAAISEASGVWLAGGQQSRLATAYTGTEVEDALQQVLARGGVIGGTSAGAAIMSRTMIAAGTTNPRMGTGFSLLPDAIIDQHFTQRERIARSRAAVAAHPGQFGLGIDEDTAVIVHGRIMRVVGTGTATFLLGASAGRDAEEQSLESGQLADLTQWRRAARARAMNNNPGELRAGAPHVAHGALVIVGGGGLPPEVASRFVELAGGNRAHIVVLPTAVPRDIARRQPIPSFLRDCGAASVTLLPQMGSDEVASDEFQDALKRATGVWFGGGRQWNFVDAYEATSAVDLFHDVLRRGGVIGGSSAGATIQGEFLVRGHPLGNTVMMAEGYERGFAFLPGTAIDQHFTQRGRQPDLVPVLQRHPALLGIGIDEGTALVVQGSRAEVIGEHAVHFLTSGRIAAQDVVEAADLTAETVAPWYVTVPTGESIELPDLQTR